MGKSNTFQNTSPSGKVRADLRVQRKLENGHRMRDIQEDQCLPNDLLSPLHGQRRWKLKASSERSKVVLRIDARILALREQGKGRLYKRGLLPGWTVRRTGAMAKLKGRLKGRLLRLQRTQCLAISSGWWRTQCLTTERIHDGNLKEKKMNDGPKRTRKVSR